MGKIIHLNKIMELFRKSPIVSFSSIKKYVNNDEYAKILVHNLIKKGKINKIGKGFYSLYNNPELSVFVFKPAYFGLQDALSFHNLWEQETLPIIVTSRKVRTGIRNIMGSNVLVRKIDNKFMFGYEYIQKNNLAYPYSDLEKTLIDLVYFKEYISDDVVENILFKIDKTKLRNYLNGYDKRTKNKILKIINSVRAHHIR